MFGQNKYRNKKTTIDGITFDSKKEADYYCELKMLKMAGVIKDFGLQPTFTLQESFKSKFYGKQRPITYTADFLVEYPNGTKEVIDVKGMKTDVYKIKKKMFLYKYPEYNFKEV